jgi:hypothetical protein
MSSVVNLNDYSRHRNKLRVAGYGILGLMLCLMLSFGMAGTALKVHEIDQMNHIFIINGVDYGEPVRRAMGL